MGEKIEKMLDLVTESDSKNKLSLEKTRLWLIQYLKRYDEELKQVPEISTESHFDLLMADYDRLREAVFFVAVFNGDYVSLAAGRGDSNKVRQFAECDFPENAVNVIPTLASRFQIFNQPIIISKLELDMWLR